MITLNWRPGAAARLGLDYETLRERYPELVYCNTRGYEKGPRSDLPGTDQNAAAMTGTEWEDGACDAGNPPLWSRSNMGDTGNALLAAIAIATALYHRDKTGEGQAVSTSIVNAGLLHTSYAWIHADGSDSGLGARGRRSVRSLPVLPPLPVRSVEWVFLAAITTKTRDEAAGAASRRPGRSTTTSRWPPGSSSYFETRWRRRPSAPSTTGACRSKWSTNSSAGTCSTIPRPGG